MTSLAGCHAPTASRYPSEKAQYCKRVPTSVSFRLDMWKRTCSNTKLKTIGPLVHVSTSVCKRFQSINLEKFIAPSTRYGRKQWCRNEFESWGALVRRESGGTVRKIFLVVPLHFFGSKSTISRFGKRFLDGQYSLVSFLFAGLLLTVPPCPAICKSGGHLP